MGLGEARRPALGGQLISVCSQRLGCLRPEAQKALPGTTTTATLLDWRTVSAPYQRSYGLTEPTMQASRESEAIIDGLLTILRISRVLERIDAEVSPQQYRILKLIGEGGERSARLAEKLAVAKPTLTATADSLVAAGLAVRQPEPGDRRVVRLCLTAAGQAAVQRADEAYATWFGSLLDYTGQSAEILADLTALNEAMTERRRARLSAGTGTGQR
jgi:DNA-binding MarR family transcriptional regulator